MDRDQVVLRDVRSLVLLAIIGCGDNNSDADAMVQIDAPSLGGFPAVISIGSSEGTIADAFELDANGSASAPLGTVAFASDVGTIAIDDASIAAFVYATTSFSSYALYDGFAISPSSWDAFYLYCETGLVDVYDEGVGGRPLFYRAATGTCVGTPTPTTAQVSLPALSIPTPVPETGYTVTGDDVVVRADGTGEITLGTAVLPLIVFDDIDCSTCATSGWYELHSIAWDDAQQHAIFFIMYLINGSTTSVELAYARSLPDLGDPIGTVTLPATWSALPTARARASMGVPPPELESSQNISRNPS